MAKSNKNVSNMSYSLKIGPSIYYVSTHRVKNLSDDSYRCLGEHASIRSKSANGSIVSSPRSQRSRSQKRSFSPERRPKTCRQGRIIHDLNVSTKRQQKTSKDRYDLQYNQAKLKKSNQISDKIITNDQNRISDKAYQTIDKEENSSIKSIKKRRKPYSEISIGKQKQEILELFNEQKQSLAQLLDEFINKINASPIDIIKQIVNEVLKSYEQTSIKELEHILVQTIHQKLEQLTSKDIDKSQRNLFDINAFNRLQEILTETIEKYMKKGNKNDNTALNHSFTERKQALDETLTQQQLTPTIDLIKQAVIDALTEHNCLSMNTNTTTNIVNSYMSTTKITNDEVQITVNLNQTRVDTAFRQQRNIIVANRYLRDTVRQWSNVRSISSLVKKIQAWVHSQK